MKKTLVFFQIQLLLFFLVLITSCNGQEDITSELNYEVNRVYPSISITKEKLTTAQTLIDLDENYKSSWIREYILVEVFTSHKGRIRKAVSKNEILSQEQKDIMNVADVGTDISVKVQYIPNNTLSHNDIKEINFTFIVNPENEAKYTGGQEQLNQYLEENAIDKIPYDSFNELDLAAVKFAINQKGQVIDAHVLETSKNEETDELLLKVISNMSDWKPAEYSNGTRVKQEFILIVGNMESCVINLLNLR